MVLWAGDRARVKIYAHVRLPADAGRGEPGMAQSHFDCLPGVEASSESTVEA